MSQRKSTKNIVSKKESHRSVRFKLENQKIRYYDKETVVYLPVKTEEELKDLELALEDEKFYGQVMPDLLSHIKDYPDASVEHKKERLMGAILTKELASKYKSRGKTTLPVKFRNVVHTIERVISEHGKVGQQEVTANVRKGIKTRLSPAAKPKAKRQRRE